MLDEIETLVEEQTKDEKLKAEKAKYMKGSSLKFLKRYGKDLTEEARAGKLDTVIGRENEIERVVTVLSRRTKSNPVLIGEAGVGKTAIVEGLATRIVKNEVPGNLIGKHIYQVDLSSVVAGTKFRGEFEERIKGIIDEATGDDSILLFIDEIHLLCGAGSSEGSMDAANILKPALARNTINLIGATTLDEYRKTIEKDKALSRRFQTVMVEEPSAAVTLRILKGIKKHYENHHGVVIPDTILETAITMSQRYINDRFMPDKVIDIIDEASAICKVAADKKGGGKYKKMKIEKSQLEDKISELSSIISDQQKKFRELPRQAKTPPPKQGDKNSSPKTVASASSTIPFTKKNCHSSYLFFQKFWNFISNPKIIPHPILSDKIKREKIQTWFVTGASSGVGHEICKQALEKGYNVIAVSRRLADFNHHNVLCLSCDVRDINSIKNAFDKGIERFGKIDVLINNAGFSATILFEDETINHVRDMFETNYFGTYNTMSIFVPYFRKNKNGTIINNTSMHGLRPRPYGAAYCSTKYALEGLTGVVASETRHSV